jgi:hypothetical protein
VSLATHTVRVTAEGCGELSQSIDFQSENGFKFLKIVRKGKKDCLLAFDNSAL